MNVGRSRTPGVVLSFFSPSSEKQIVTMKTENKKAKRKRNDEGAFIGVSDRRTERQRRKRDEGGCRLVGQDVVETEGLQGAVGSLLTREHHGTESGTLCVMQVDSGRGSHWNRRGRWREYRGGIPQPTIVSDAFLCTMVKRPCRRDT